MWLKRQAGDSRKHISRVQPRNELSGTHELTLTLKTFGTAEPWDGQFKGQGRRTRTQRLWRDFTPRHVCCLFNVIFHLLVYLFETETFLELVAQAGLQLTAILQPPSPACCLYELPPRLYTFCFELTLCSVPL